MKSTPDEVSEFFMRIVEDHVAYRKKNNIFRKDLMQLLIQLKNNGKMVDDEKLPLENITEQENELTLKEIAAQVFVFFGAGFETSSTAMTFGLYELARNMEIQE
ncbi:hypothetical protein WA026_009045 [Henosepilachna vigintioctopunctata]|uniref:Cytochrome P450 n=1 Tax=Henosepilachna vigintioctopunctata TaxID=420089 RepID=A0AAW1UUK5_9CUCU